MNVGIDQIQLTSLSIHNKYQWTADGVEWVSIGCVVIFLYDM